MKYAKYFLLTFFLIALDQAVKLWVHTNMEMGIAGQIEVFGDWFKLYYTLNPGMAFGMQFGSEYGKLGLSLFRLVAMFFIAYYLYKLAKEKTHPGVLWSMAAVLAGAIGNLIDSIFYGVWLDNAPYNAISPWFHGQVVDMFYIDIWEGRVADWVPLWGGDYISLWPIFNIADAAIFCGVAVILIFQKKFFKAVKQEVAE
ncbi:lipoprotein signal peptidase [Marivirga tractuosa]|uniref:Lipoprotein signal peptidase n=1 Tax=Marivirga tractuosa (strain ATCC 23168 / DSM 4126 / NBRC 15989 / NCIMB 1408 / VKM B-1430 / H-43) TaxID=643867 RepID=E4TN30_MARTH|nr:lipoprotein signal peptidase [Marivirga tractuosa]ADR22444.1 signal peptidase II [Marivirga tractuosa DSM 4126]BDD16885.1 lipoprotein signal peptidase [Marivirga tractuosa]